VPLDTLAWWEARGWTAAPAPLPTDLGFPGLEARYELHAADETIHGGGRRLGQAALSADPAVFNSSTPAPIPGLSTTFIVPDDDYDVEFQATILVDAAAAWGTIELWGQIGAGAAGLLGSDGHYAAAANSVKTLKYTYPVPPPAGVAHQPVAGDEVTYHLRCARAVGTGNVTVIVNNGFWGKNAAFIRARALAG
jgi:hypothetical protein